MHLRVHLELNLKKILKLEVDIHLHKDKIKNMIQLKELHNEIVESEKTKDPKQKLLMIKLLYKDSTKF